MKRFVPVVLVVFSVGTLAGCTSKQLGLAGLAFFGAGVAVMATGEPGYLGHGGALDSGIMLVGAGAVCLGRAGTAERRHERARLQRERRKRVQGFLSRERETYPDRFSEMRKKRNLGYGLILGGCLLMEMAVGDPTNVNMWSPLYSPPEVNMPLRYLGIAGCAAGVALEYQYWKYVKAGSRARFVIGPTGASLTYRF